MSLEGARGTVSIIDKATAPLKNIAKSFMNMGKSASDTVKDINANSKALGKLATMQNRLGRIQANNQYKTRDIGGQAVGVVALGLAFKNAVQPAIEFESAFAGVKKVASGTPKQIKELEKDLLSLTATIPKTVVELSQIAEAGAKMGFDTTQLVQFTTIVAKASTAFDISADEAGASLGKISSVLGLGMKGLSEYGDRVNFLADSIAADSAGIIDITKRVAGAYSSLNLGLGDISGLSAFADQMSVSSEIGASALNQIINRFKATKRGAKLFEKEGGNALVTLAKEFKKLDGLARSKAITKMFGTGEGSRMFEKMISQTEKLEKALELGNSNKAIGSMTREFEAMSKTTANSLVLLTNSVNRIFITFGSKLAPTISSIAKSISGLSEPISNFIDNNETLIKTVGIVAGVILTAKVATLAYTATIWLVSPALAGLSATLNIVKIAMVAFNLVMAANPIGLMVTGITLLAVGATALVANWEKVGAFFTGLWEKITKLTDAFSKLNVVAGARKQLDKTLDFFGLGSDEQDTNEVSNTSTNEVIKNIQAQNNINNKAVIQVNVANGQTSVQSTGDFETEVEVNNGVQQ